MSPRRRPRAAFAFGMFDLEAGLAVDHQYRRSPGVIRPGEPVLLHVDVATGYRDVEVLWRRDGPAPATPESVAGGHVAPAHPSGSGWTAVLPGMEDGTAVHYLVRATDRGGTARYADGRRPRRAATVFTHRVTSRVPPEWARRAVVYQVFVDRFATAAGPVAEPPRPDARAGGDLDGVRAAVPYIADLGATVIWLTPVFTATSYHGYDAEDLFHVDARFGGDGALAALVDAVHEAGMRLVLDFVPNHVSSRHPWFLDARAGGERRDWFRIRPDGTYDTFFGHEGLPKVNLEHPAARGEMIAAARHWLDRFGIDGYRIDHVLGPSEGFFAALAADLNARHPEAWLFGEATATPAYVRRYGGILDGATDFPTSYAFRDLLAGELAAAGFVEVEQEAGAVLPHADFTWVRFLDNHDMDRALHVWGDDPRLLLAGLDALTGLPGVPAVLYGTEQGLTHGLGAGDHGLEVGRRPMRYDDPLGLLAPVRELLRGRRDAAALPADGVLWTVSPGELRWTWRGASHRLDLARRDPGGPPAGQVPIHW